jgi:hypothetical protein
MKSYFNLSGFFLLLFLNIIEVRAQSTIPAGGGNASGTGGTVSYSVGQMLYTGNTGTTGSVAQGVQQPFEISVITGLERAININLICSVYPNPTVDFLTLKVENYDREGLSYKLFDVNGKLLESKKVTRNETSISMTNYIPAIYFLRVTDNRKEIITFKIIKNN